MASAAQIKKNMYEEMVQVVQRDQMVELNKLIAIFSADSGFNERTIRQMIKHLVILEKIKIKDNIVTPSKWKTKQE